jgi:uncharacterized protein (TIGR00725 family)
MTRPIATFFGGVTPASADEEVLAFQVGQVIGALGYELHHGGYNGLMEHAARGAATSNAPIVANTLSGKEEWGAFNPYVTEPVYAHGMGQRMTDLVERSDVIVAMAGGVGSLHELTAALWYSGNIRKVPILVLGDTAHRLITFLKQERWLYESPTRPLDFLHDPASIVEARQLLQQIAGAAAGPKSRAQTLEDRVLRAGSVDGTYKLPNGETVSGYFDPFRLASDPTLSTEVAAALARKVRVLPDAVAGLALGGVALATDLSRALGRPLLIVRPQPKAYGTFAQIEGSGAVRGQRVLVVDDVVRSGRQMLSAIRVLQQADMIVPEAMCVLERSDTARILLKEENVDLQSMWTDQDPDNGGPCTSTHRSGG